MPNTIKMKVTLKDAKYNAVFEAEEHDNKSGYGCGKYISILRNGVMFDQLDCRYMKEYNLKGALELFLKDYFGENLISMEVVE